MVVSHHQNARQKRNLLIANKSFQSVGKFKSMETTATYENSTHKEINSRLHSGNACYHTLQSLLSSRFLSKNINNFCRILTMVCWY
jgi:hypothetical protein